MKKKIIKFLDENLWKFIKIVHKLHFYIVNKNKSGINNYEFLTANDEAKNIDEYTKALDEALNDKKVKNIAVSGSYGSGKSSFLTTYEKNKLHYNFLDISLATFSKKSIEGTDNKIDLSLIEKSIIEQMFYKVKNKTIPQSRLNKINRLKWIPLKIISILVVILAYYISFSPKTIESITLLKEISKINTTEYWKYLPILFLIIGAYYLIQKMIIILSNTNIEKLNLKNLEIVSNNDSASLLNKYLDEILYFFEKTNFDVVVFQDLDRFDNLDIFTKLRELNNFINNSEQVNKKVVFIYAVKDEMFKNASQRTKFFDFIIPVIPYINATNSKDILLDYFDDVNRNLLYDISLYISDMRLLKNIYNEYSIYTNSLEEDIDKTKLLSMIIYKNFEPQDFESLHKGEGLVYSIFNTKNSYIKPYIKIIESDIEKIEEKILYIKDEPREKIKELRQLYILEIISTLNSPFDGKLYAPGVNTDIQKSVEDEPFNFLKCSVDITSKFMRNGRLVHSTPISFKTAESSLGEYEMRAQLIEDKTNNKIETLHEEIRILQSNQYKIKSMTLKEIFENYSDIEIFNESYEEKALLKYLLSYGHIDENYEEYISNFFGVSITRDEQTFLRNIKSNSKSVSFNVKLKNLQEIVNHRLTSNEFRREGVLNYSLMTYLLENRSTYPSEIKSIFEQLSNDSDISKKFILYFSDTTHLIKEFINLLTSHYSKLWLFFTKDAYKKLHTYFDWIIYFAEYSDILKLNQDDTLIHYLSNTNFMQPFSGEESKKVVRLIEDLKVVFTKLDSTPSTEIIDCIFTGFHYELNPHMINRMIFSKRTSKSEVEESLRIAHLTTIQSDKLIKDKDILLQYINENINEYIKGTFLKIDTNTQESEETIVGLINNENLEETLKIEILRKEEEKISDISAIEDKSFWHILLKENKLMPSWINISLYYDYTAEMDALLIQYLNIEENALCLSEVRVGKKYSTEYTDFNKKILRKIIEISTFDLISYGYLIENIGYLYEDLDISNLDEEKISLLVTHNIFQFTKNNFVFLKEHSSSSDIELVEKNKNDLLKKFEDFEFDTSDLIKIFKSSNISDTIKKDMIEEINYNFISNNSIASLIYTYVDKSIIKSIEYSRQMLQNLESLESKINLVVKQESEFNDEELIEILELLPDSYSKIANQDGTQTVLVDNYYNQSFIQLMEDRNFITKNKLEKKNKLRLYIKNREV